MKDPPSDDPTTTATFADDTAILSIGDSQADVNLNLQHDPNRVAAWALDWRIILNEISTCIFSHRDK